MSLTWYGSDGEFSESQFRRLVSPLKREVPKDAEIVTAYTNGQVTLRSNRDKIGYHEAADLSNFQGVEPGDLVVHGLDILRGSVGVSDSQGAISSVCTVCTPNSDMDGRFIAFAIRAQADSGFTRALARGIREGGADFRRWDTLAELPIPKPSLEEQRRIADFLDDQVGRIDQTIELRRQQLKIADQIDISRSHILLTRGLSNANQAAHPSESWIESIPIEWRAPQLARLASFRAGAFIQAEDISEDGPYPVYGANGLRGYGAEFSHEGLTVLIGRQGALCGNVTLVDGKFWASEHALVCYPNFEFSLTWFSHALRAMDLGQYSVSAAQPGISVERINSLQIPLPPLKEQLEIAQVLEDFTRAHHEARGLLDRSVIHLEERKRSLITAAVTGHLDVTSASPLTGPWVSAANSAEIELAPEPVGMSL